MLHASRPIIKICSNTVFCITFSAMLVIWHYLYKLQCQILVHLSHFSVRIRLTYGDQFGNRSQTLKNCCKTGESRESVNSAKMPQNGPGGGISLLLFTALGIVKNSRFCMSLCYILFGLFLQFAATLFSASHLVLC